MTPNDAPGDPGTPPRRPRREDPTPEQRGLLDLFAQTQPDPKDETRALQEMHDAGLTDEAIHHELTHTYRKQPPSPEAIRERRCLWRVYGDRWPDAPVTHLRLCVRYARQVLGLGGVHEIDGEQAEKACDVALKLLSEAKESGWTTRWLAQVIGQRTKPVCESVPADRAVRAGHDGDDRDRAFGDDDSTKEPQPQDGDTADEEVRENREDEEASPAEDDLGPVVPPPDDFSPMVELARQLAGTDVPADAAARRAVLLTVVDVAVRVIEGVDSGRERGALLACLRDRLPLDELTDDGPDRDDDDADGEDDDTEFDS